MTRDELGNPDGATSMPDIGNFVPVTPAEVTAFLASDASSEIAARVPARFAVGEKVIVNNDHPKGHTRMPRYLRSRRGTIHRHHGVHGFQDDVSDDVGQLHLYTVKFTGSELWGSRAQPNDVVYAEWWDYHLQPAA